jgi:hypothetical protein
MSTSEFMRRAILRHDAADDERKEEAELRALLDVFALTHAETLEQLDRVDRALDDALAYFAAKERKRARWSMRSTQLNRLS